MSSGHDPPMLVILIATQCITEITKSLEEGLALAILRTCMLQNAGGCIIQEIASLLEQPDHFAWKLLTTCKLMEEGLALSGGCIAQEIVEYFRTEHSLHGSQ